MRFMCFFSFHFGNLKIKKCVARSYAPKNVAPIATTQIEFVDSAYNEEAYENGAYIFTKKMYTSSVFTRIHSCSIRVVTSFYYVFPILSTFLESFFGGGAGKPLFFQKRVPPQNHPQLPTQIIERGAEIGP